MNQHAIASILDEIGTLLELNGENPFRCQAYHTAARALEQIEISLVELVSEGKLDSVPGVGATLREKITTLATTGRLPFYDDLKAKTPPGLIQMLRLPGMGPKKVKAIHDQLGIDSLAMLLAACQEDKVAALKGFGKRTQQKILEGLEFLSTVGQRIRLDQAWRLGQLLLEGIRDCPGIVRMELCGSLRRRKDTINDIDILISSSDPGPIMDRFVTLPVVSQVLARGEAKASVSLDKTLLKGKSIAVQADLRVVEDHQFPFALHYFTGSKEHNVAMRARAQKYGLKLNEYELSGLKKSIACKDEEDIFEALKLDYIPPELRENTGELEAAANHTLPDLVTRKDLRGTFHCHTDWSDGQGTLEDMAQAAQDLGFQYLGIGDHSQSLTVARGLTPDRIKLQHAEIDALNSRLHEFRVFKGTECDILPDGRLDFDDETLESFDYVVASVHSNFQQTEAEMTARIIHAVRHPRVTMLGHATGRLLLQREGYKVDLDAVLQAAAESGTMIEINSQPKRLELDSIYCKKAKALGITLVVNPDAHSPGDLEYVGYGIDIARRGWLERSHVFNTKTLAQVSKALGVKSER